MTTASHLKQGARARVCAKCGRPSPAEHYLCDYCMNPLPTESVTIEVPPPTACARRRRFTSRRIAIIGALIGTMAVVYVTSFRSPPDFDLTTGTRSLLASSDAWPSEGGNIGATRTTTSDPPIKGEIAWRKPIPTAPTGGLIVDKRAVYVPTDGQLFAFNVTDGRELWSIPLTGLAIGTPILSDGVIYVLHHNGNVVAVNTTDGSEVWRRATGVGLYSSAVLVDGRLWLGGTGEAISIDADTGEELGRRAFGNDSAFAVGVVAADGKRVIMHTHDRVRSFDHLTGQLVFWARLRFPTHVATGNGVTVSTSNRFMLVHDDDSILPWWEGLRVWWKQIQLMGLAPTVPEPTLRWGIETKCIPMAPAIATTQVVLGCTDGRVRGFAIKEGTPLWEHQAAALVDGPILTPKGVLLNEGNALTLLDAATGTVLYQRMFEGFKADGIAPTASGIYLATTAGEVVAIR